jgi:subtilase family serine protease
LKNWKRSVLSVIATGSLLFGASPLMSLAKTTSANVTIPQGTGTSVLDGANYFGDLDPNQQVTVDFVLKVKNKDQLAQYIKDTATRGSRHYRDYLSVKEFKDNFAPSSGDVLVVTKYLQSFGISTSVYNDNLVVTATGTVAQFNKALNVELQNASYKGKSFHGTKKQPSAPRNVADSILCILGLSDYSNLTSHAEKQAVKIPANSDNALPGGGLSPQDLIKRYNVQPLYDKGATGAGQTIGIVTLADFVPQDAYDFWKTAGINVKPNRITKTDVDGGSGWSGSDETTLDVEQSGALAPQANIHVYVGPNTDTGFVDAFAKAINDNQAQQVSVSWGQSESSIDYFVKQNMESPAYTEAFNQLFMQAAAQGQSMFAAAGDAGAYDNTRSLGMYDLSVDFPSSSPYITAAGGTTTPFSFTSKSTGINVSVPKERAWSWDYLYPLLQAYGYTPDNGPFFEGGGGGFSTAFATPDYQKGIKGVNTYSAVQQWDVGSDLAATPTYDSAKPIVTGTGTGRNVPDLSMDADPESGYSILFTNHDTGQQEWDQYGGTSFVAPQLNGLSALINSANHTQVGFWNPQIYQFAQGWNSPLTPLNDTSADNDNLFYTGTAGTLYNQATGLGTPDVAKLAWNFGSSNR